MRKPAKPTYQLTEWERHDLRIALLEVCDVEAGIGISDLHWHERLVSYLRADPNTFRAILDGLVATGMIFQRGQTSGKMYRTLPLGQALLPLYHRHPPDMPRVQYADQANDPPDASGHAGPK